MNAINISINGFRLKHDVIVLPCVEVNYQDCLPVSCLQMVDCLNFTHFCAVS